MPKSYSPRITRIRRLRRVKGLALQLTRLGFAVDIDPVEVRKEIDTEINGFLFSNDVQTIRDHIDYIARVIKNS